MRTRTSTRGAALLAIWAVLCPSPGPAEASPKERLSKIPQDFRVGVAVAMQFERQYPLVKDPELQKRVRDLGYRVAAASGQSDTYFVFNVLNMADPNAVALPGGFIYVTKGILDLGLEDDELAHILSHECSHVIREHHQRIQKSVTLLNLVNMAVLAGAILAARNTTTPHSTTTLGMDRAGTPGGAGDQIATAAILSNVASSLFLLRYVREYEIEADRTGRALASGAGFDPHGSENMLRKLLSRSYERPGMGIVRTHPYLEERIKIAEAASEDLTRSPAPRDPAAYRDSVQGTLFYRATEFHGVFKEAEAQFLLRSAYHAMPEGSLADDCKFQSLEWLQANQDRKPYRQRDYGYFVNACEEILREFPNTNLRMQVTDQLAKLKKARDDIFPGHLQKLEQENIVPAFGEYFLRNYPTHPRLREARFKLAHAYLKARDSDRSAELFLELLEDPKAAEWWPRIHDDFRVLLPRLSKVGLAYDYHLHVQEEAAKQGLRGTITELIRESESIEDLGSLMEDHPTNAFREELQARLTVLAKDTLTKARVHRGSRDYSAAAFEYYKVARYAPDRALAALASDELQEMQKLE